MDDNDNKCCNQVLHSRLSVQTEIRSRLFYQDMPNIPALKTEYLAGL